MRHLTIVGEIVDHENSSGIYEALKSGVPFHGMRLVMLGMGDQVTKPMEVCEAVANLSPFPSAKEIRELIQQAKEAMQPEK